MVPSACAEEILYAPAGQYQPSEDTDWPARTVVFGASFAGVADDDSALFLNPAGLAWLDHTEISLTNDFGSLETFRETALAGVNISPGNSLGFSATYLSFGTLQGWDDYGDSANDYGADQFSGQSGWGTQILEGLSLGFGIEFSSEALAGTSYEALRPDLSVLFRPFPGWRVGMDYTFSGWGAWPGQNVSAIKTGLSWEKSLDSQLRMLVACGGLFQSDQTDRLQGAVEIAYADSLFARAGYEFEPNGEAPSVVSLGAGFVVAGLNFDYAYLPYGDVLGSTHRISLTVPFSVSSEPSNVETFPGKPKTGLLISNLSAQNRKPSFATETASAAASEMTAEETARDLSSGLPNKTLTKATEGSDLGPSSGKASVADTPTPSASLVVQFSIPADLATQAQMMTAQGDYSKALGIYLQALKQDLRNPRLWRGLGEVYGKLGHADYSVFCYKKALKWGPDQKDLSDWLADYEKKHSTP
ncbi:MAG: tetratricopeptide repeat protein [bacterium]